MKSNTQITSEANKDHVLEPCIAKIKDALNYRQKGHFKRKRKRKILSKKDNEENNTSEHHLQYHFSFFVS